MYDQRNKQCQTLILAATIMLSALVTMIIQGILPSRTPNVALLLYSISSTASLGMLFLCIIIYILLVIKSSKFMYRKRSKEYNKQLSEASKSTQFLFDEHEKGFTNRSIDSWDEPINDSSNNDNNKRPSIFKTFSRKIKNQMIRRSKPNDSHIINDGVEASSNYVSSSSSSLSSSIVLTSDDITAIDINNTDDVDTIDLNNFYKPDDDDDDTEFNGLLTSPRNPYETPRRSTLRKKIFDLDLTAIEQEYIQHDEIIKKFLTRRDRINRNYSRLLFGDNTFDNYWNNYCNFHHQVGVLLFYFGTGLLLIALMIYNWAYFTYTYELASGGIVSAVIIGSALILGILFRFSFKIIQNQTTHEWEKLKEI